MSRKTHIAFLVVFGLVLSTQARFLSSDAYSGSEEENGILPLNHYSVDDESRQDDVPDLDVRLGIPVDYDNDKQFGNGVILRNKIGEDSSEEKEVKKKPGWLKRQWRRFGSLTGAISGPRRVSAAKMAEFTENVCNKVKLMVSRAAVICQVIPLNICAKFYAPADPDSITLPDANALET